MLQAYVSSVSGTSDIYFMGFHLNVVKYIWMLHNMHVASVYFKCFIHKLQVFHLNVAKVDLDVANVFNGYTHVFQVFYMCFRNMFASVSAVSDVYCKCLIWMLQNRSGFCIGLQWLHMCFQVFCKCFKHMFESVSAVSDICCKCFIWML
jgi:hypothetical protein